MKFIEKNLTQICLILVIVLVFLLVGLFTNENTFSNAVKTSPSGFTDSGETCIIDNVKYDVIVDNYSKIVYLMNPNNATLVPLFNRYQQPMTFKEYSNR